MGCFSSKEHPEPQQHTQRAASANSQDSGIGLSCPNQSTSAATTSDNDSLVQTRKSRKGIAFNVSTRGIIRQHPPKKPLSGLRSRSSAGSSRNQPLRSISPRRRARPPPKLLDRQKPKILTAEELAAKQEQAERKREMERLATIARLHRRELRAKKIKDRREQELAEWEAEGSGDELSDVDVTFNDQQEFTWDDDLSAKDETTSLQASATHSATTRTREPSVQSDVSW